MPSRSDIAAVEAFARAVAKMQDPFEDRARTLAEMSLDEAAWEDLQQQWSRALADHAARGDQAFVEAFRLAFQQAQEDVRTQRTAIPSRHIPAQPPPSPIDRTAEAHALPIEALPFQPSADPPPPPPVSPTTPTDAPTEASDDVDRTALLTEAPWRKALPFGEED